MPTVDFLPFATSGGANVENQADYVADATFRANGFQSGVANSAKFNKALRQSSIMSAVLAQFIADLSGQNVIDDGSISTILANMKGAIGGRPGHTYTANDWAYIDKSAGLIIQWGTVSVGADTTASITWPVAFINGPLHGSVSQGIAISTSIDGSCAIYGMGTVGATVTNGLSASTTLRYFSIGI